MKPIKYLIRSKIRFLFKENSFRILLFCLIYLPFFYACEFQPGDLVYTNVEKPSDQVPMISVNLTPETDTLRLSDPVTIKYKFDASPRDIHWVEFSFDDVVLFQQDYQQNNSLEMNLNPHIYREGLHHLTIKVFTSTNSGSIADKVKAEGYLYQMEWPVLIDFTPLKILKILEVKNQAGGALIKWERFSHAAFKNYMLEKIPFFENTTRNIAVITNPYNTEFFDSEYLEGEKVYYRIYLSGLPGEGVYYSCPPGPIVSKWNFGFNATVTWEPTQNPNRLDYYRIFLQDWNSSESEKHIRYEEKREITYEKLSLGNNILINLQNVPKTTISNYSFQGLESSSAEIAIGDPIPVHEIAKKVFGTNYTLLNNGNKLILFDHETRQRVDSLDFGNVQLRAYRISPDGKTVYTLTGNIFQAWELPGFIKLRSVDLTHIDSKLSELFDISVSSNSRILFTVSGEKIVVYDFANDKILLAPDQIIGWSKISPDGKRFMARYTQGSTHYRLYDIELNEAVLKGEVVFPGETWGNYFFFSGTEVDQIIICHDTEIQVRKVSDFSLLSKLNGSSWGYADYDPETNLLIWGGPSNECYIYKLPSGEITKTVYLARGIVILHRNFLIGRNGRQLDLSKL